MLLPRIDADLAAKVQAAGCLECGGRLDVANYPGEPRGADGLGDDFSVRASFCCAVDGCRRRRTPMSVRFLGRKVYAPDASMNDGFELRELDVAILDVRPVLIAQHQVVFVCALDDVEPAGA